MENEYIDVPWWFELPTKEEYKFIKLFEEYLVKYNSEYWPINCSINIPWITLMWIHESVIISKKFWFVKWLVEHQKIDLFTPKQYFFDKIFSDTYEWDFVCEVYEIVIIVLSIQDNPIKYLCSILR